MSGTRNLEGLKTQVLTCIEAAYDKGYKAAKQDVVLAENKSEYKHGLNDAWECAKKIVTDNGLNYEELEKIFGYQSMDAIFRIFSAPEAVAKIKEYEDRQKKTDNEIHVGDEFYLTHGTYKHTVIRVSNNGEIFALRSDGVPVWCTCEEIHKTGRKYPVAEMLEGVKK